MSYELHRSGSRNIFLSRQIITKSYSVVVAVLIIPSAGLGGAPLRRRTPRPARGMRAIQTGQTCELIPPASLSMSPA
ncbi:hypothetical protein P168DRAFT_159750 [Aspergillus campestris IBT 28561]|uniref:Uncharacterized protein n=1 Tax=Aspergillus campestris (strain IBT 28561) TaxID=1392248 RepID=A0A2I1D3V3_ASPC2|nr:uncharacterized protein P168DRAFT_159750 [Aspergillus campestris IBT 28561]PKY04553.1 hypothetical protein P168DRAFT_159750 [Aspergillus campestris IBT 28561]